MEKALKGGATFVQLREKELDEELFLEEAKKIKKLWGDKKLCAKYSANCKDISFDTIDEYYEKIMKVYQ